MTGCWTFPKKELFSNNEFNQDMQDDQSYVKGMRFFSIGKSIFISSASSTHIIIYIYLLVPYMFTRMADTTTNFCNIRIHPFFWWSWIICTVGLSWTFCSKVEVWIINFFFHFQQFFFLLKQQQSFSYGQKTSVMCVKVENFWIIEENCNVFGTGERRFTY